MTEDRKDKYDEIIDDLSAQGIDFRKLRDRLDSVEYKEANEKRKARIAENSLLYKNKCYKVESEKEGKISIEYLKVVSEYANDSYSVKVLSFPDKPSYRIKMAMRKYMPIDYECSTNWELDTICLKSIKTDDLENYTEISLEEYNEAMKNHIEKLSAMTFERKNYVI